MKICSIDGCGHRRDSYGFCATHARRFKSFGDPLGGKPLRARKGEIDSFLSTAISSEQDECIFWPFAKNSAGYGHFQRGNFRSLAHRYVCHVVKGDPFEGAVAAHECGNGHLSCINHRHLNWKTKSENSADMVTHGTSIRGKHPKAKLNEQGAAYIKQNAGKISAINMGNELGVSRHVVHQVLAGNNWKWVTVNEK
jgi:hypothetical protein